MEQRKNLFALTKRVTDAVAKQGTTEGGRHRVLSLKIILYGPDKLPMALGIVQPEGTDKLLKLTAFKKSCDSFADLVTITNGSVINILNYQMLNPMKMQLLKSSKVGPSHDQTLDNFLRPPILTLGELMDSRHKVAVTEMVEIREVRPSTRRPAYPVCGACRCPAVEDAESCSVCGNDSVVMQFGGTIVFGNPEGLEMRAFVDAGPICRLMGLKNLVEFTEKVNEDSSVDFARNATMFHAHLLLTERYFKPGTTQVHNQDDNHIYYNVEQLYYGDELPESSTIQNKRLKKRK